jgi:hypothetical protein
MTWIIEAKWTRNSLSKFYILLSKQQVFLTHVHLLETLYDQHGANGGARGAPAPPTAAGLVEPLVLPFQF